MFKLQQNFLENSLEENQKGDYGKRRILSIIVQDFTYQAYQELQEKLGVFIFIFILLICITDFPYE